MPEYDPKAPAHVHEESSELAKRLHHETMKAGKSFVYDGTGANAASLAAKMKASKDAGYQVHLHYAAVPLETAKQRNRSRARQVPEHVLEEQHAQVRESFGKVRHMADKVRVFDNSSPGVSPYAAKRAEKLKYNEGAGSEDATVEKAHGMAHNHPTHRRPIHRMSSDSGAKKHPLEDGKTRHIHLKGNHYIVGKVRDGHVHVEDIVHDGHSERAMTGKRPDLTPIPVSKLEAMGARFEDAPVGN